MIRVTIGNNLNRKTVTIDPSMTIKQLLQEQSINENNGVLTLDGCYLERTDLNKTFTEYGIEESCILLSVVKADNA